MLDDEEKCFVIQKFDSGERRYPKGWDVVQFLKGERISEVMLVRDNITMNKGDEIVSDSGIVIRTNENVYSISRNFINIRVNESDKMDMPLSVEIVRKQCTDDYWGIEPAEVKREFIPL